MASNSETKGGDNVSELPHPQQELQHLKGLKLYSIMIGLTIATFLISLDVSVIATVRVHNLFQSSLTN
jgi:hypothetical protein